LIVTAANDFTAQLNDRMPVLLDRQDQDAWLSGKAGVELLRPAPNDLLRMWPVSKWVNASGRGDDDDAAAGARVNVNFGRLIMTRWLFALLLSMFLLAGQNITSKADWWTQGQADWARHGFRHGRWDCYGRCPDGHHGRHHRHHY
jgi:SOS response associated peptidase (SRAP)